MGISKKSTLLSIHYLLPNTHQIREMTIKVTSTITLHAMYVVVFWALPTPHENLANGGGEGWGLSHPTKNYK